ncbi:hypothetical protein HZB06_01930 [Candidatus Wolfebacteria bacterium]|nr:hypothetical protein [Candidatus Wolfebacteria bacterium]
MEKIIKNKSEALMFVAAIILALGIYYLPKTPAKNAVGVSPSVKSAESLIDEVNPKSGYTINAEYGDIGYKLVRDGAIDFKKFKSVYDQSGAPLTDEQIKILSDGLSKKITVNSDNAYFLLNFFWALGLANKNPVLDNGEMTKYGKDKINSFASTGGWTIGKKPVMEIYSNSKIIVLTSEQQKKVEEVSANVYRPCCGNSTAFPDCNHGMALLGVLELMASNNASTEEMFEAAKYFNAFWFSQNYLDLALYFKTKEGLDFKDIDAKILMSKEYSSASGWRETKKWLTENNLIEKAPASGGSCGV